MNSFRWLQFLAFGFVIWTTFNRSLLGDDSVPRAMEKESTFGFKITDVQLGFQGRYKVGCWTPVAITLQNGAASTSGQLDITTPDGDGVPVRYVSDAAGLIQVAANESRTIVRYVRFGRSRNPLAVRWTDAKGQVVTKSFSALDLSTGLFSYQRLAVTIGAAQGVEDSSKTQGQEDRMQHVTIDDPAHLPDHWMGYEGVNLLIIPTSQPEYLEKLTSPQAEAIRQWVKLGGRVLFLVGSQGKTVLAKGQPFADFAPGDFQGITSLRRNAGLEHFVNANVRLDVVERGPAMPLRATSLANVRGRIEVLDGSGVEGEVPLVVRSWYGLGYVTFAAFDLDQPPISVWPERPKLIIKLIQEQLRRNEEERPQEKGGRVVHLGYDDLVGQLRSGLEQFEGVTMISFSLVAVLMVVYLAFLGPADFFALRYWQRPEWTWVSFPLIVFAFVGVAWAVSRGAKSSELLVNQVDVVDLDTGTQTLRGTSWAHLYSPVADRYDVALKPSATQAAKVEPNTTGVLTTWQGLPGRGFGGLNGEPTQNLFPQEYQSVASTNSSGIVGQTSIHELMIPIGSTKSLTARWWGEANAVSSGALTANVTHEDILRGTFANPLQIELQECVVLFGKSVFVLDHPLAPGEVVNMDAPHPKKDLERRLTRRRISYEQKETNLTWDSSGQDVDRILEIMSFHEAAGGQPYTKVGNRYQAYVDLSEQLRLGRAVLVGRSNAPAADWQRDGHLLKATKNWTYYRIVFPVTYSKTRGK